MSAAPEDSVTINEPPTLGQIIRQSKETSDILPTSLFVQHLATYPAVAALVGLIASSPPVKVLLSNAIPVAKALSERSKPVTEPVVKRASPIVGKVDKACDSVLTNVVDKNFPILKTAQPKDFVEIATKPVGDARAAVSQRVVVPLRSVTHKARSQYSKIYDTQGKALIRSRVDPLVHPLNERLQAVIVEYLPAQVSEGAKGAEGAGADLPKSEDVSNEVSRTIQLAKTAVIRAKPSIDSQIITIKELPKNANAHFRSVLEEKKSAKTPEGGSLTLYSSLLAYVDTGRQLTSEGTAVLVDRLQGPKNALLVPVKSLYKNVEEAEEEAKQRVHKATVYLQSFIPGQVPVQVNGSA